MNQYNSINDIELEAIEHGRLLEAVNNAKVTRVLKLYVPKIMSMDNKGVREYNVRINPSLLINDPSNIPRLPNMVKACNYMSVPLVESAFKGPYREDSSGCIRLAKDESITCVIPNGNIKDIRAVDWSVM